ncbi:MAG: hypothetical protein P1U74_02385 [Legionellaceae bacterium]|nr:hypothetical protein [Legionellaceae bacterium]
MQKHLQLLFANKNYAILCTMILAMIPFTSWLAVVFVALITLRKGWREGAMLVIPVTCVFFGCSLVATSTFPAIVNSMTLFVPCYLAACALRTTMTWQSVVCVFFLLISLTTIGIQLFAPEFIISQYVYLQGILRETQSDTAIVKMLSETKIDQAVIASYAFGLQMLSIMVSALIALMTARSIQSRLYNPGGFKQEVLSFRANKLAMLVLLIIFGAACGQNIVAMILLPSVVLYFLLAGMSVCANVVDRKNSRLLLLLLVPLILVPFVTVPFYSMLGLIDSFLNLRLFSLKPRKRG